MYLQIFDLGILVTNYSWLIWKKKSSTSVIYVNIVKSVETRVKDQ